jgi:hypothetical protein
MSPADLEALKQAVNRLETPGFVARLAGYVGVPIEAVLRRLPSAATHAVRQSVTTALGRCMDAALFGFESNNWKLFRSESFTKAAVAVTGAGAGAFGLPALALELPVTTSVMLRSIAEIARTEGEDVKSPEGRVACLEVFALGGRSSADDDAEIGYFAVRAALAQEVTAAIRFLNATADRQAAPVLIRLVEAIGARFGIVVSEKAAAGAIPVIGAVGGATINTLFMDHYQDMAHGHFTVRRLERQYGAEAVRREYERCAADLKVATK